MRNISKGWIINLLKIIEYLYHAVNKRLDLLSELRTAIDHFNLLESSAVHWNLDRYFDV